jgi:hypothetical protein
MPSITEVSDEEEHMSTDRGTLRPYMTMWVVRDIDAAYHSKYDRYGANP